MGKFENIASSAIDLVHISDVLDNLGIFNYFSLFYILLFTFYYCLCDRHNRLCSSSARKKSSQPSGLYNPPTTNISPTCSCLPSLHTSCSNVCMLGDSISHVCDISFLSCVEVSAGGWGERCDRFYCRKYRNITTKMEQDEYIPDGTDSGHFSIKNHRFSRADPELV